jgi:Holliday junction resolvase RusA-like endonuclease
MRVMNGHVIHNKGSELAAWRSAIALSAKKVGARPEKNPVAIDLIFVQLKPKTVKRNEPSVAPDLDKLIRAVLDALTAIAYVDDGQVTEIYARKVYGETTGLKVQLKYKPL